jgi:predicted TIM-barrel fold metal-dependent hydrolase
VLAHRELDAGELLDVLSEAVPDREAKRAILAGNPARLYGFDGGPAVCMNRFAAP